MLKLKWSQVLNPVDYNSKRITKPDKDFAKKIDFKDIEDPVKVIDIHKIKKRKRKEFISIGVFGYENKEKYPIYVSKKCGEKHVDL